MSTATNLAVADEVAPEVPSPGTPFGGGFYAGSIIEDGLTYAMVVPPKAIGEIARVAWKTDWQKATPGTQSVIDGFANTEAMIKAGGHPIADWIVKVRQEWFEDAFIPSRDQLEVIHRNLKPGTASNYTYASRLDWYRASPGQYNGVDEHGNGHNAHSIPPGEAYTAASPAQTIAEAFREGGPEAFERGWYWSSTEVDPAFAWFQYFVDGFQGVVVKGLVLRARAVRKVLISTSPIPLAA